jgi:arylsulfatase A-like enzyme
MKIPHILGSPSVCWPTVALSLVAGLASLTAAAGNASAERPPAPNIVLIIADDLGYGDLGCYGATRLKTPQIDRLAAQGRRFTRGYAPSSTCTPSRYALLTGEYGWRQPPKKTSILDGDAPLCIEPGRLTVPALLRRAGYTTGLVGKWHLGLGDGEHPVDFNAEIRPGPLEIGFDYAFFLPATVDRVPTVFIENRRVVGLDPADPIRVSYQTRVGNEPTGAERPDLLKQPADTQHSSIIVNGISRIGSMSGGRSARWVDEDMADTIAGRAVQFIERYRGRPFFLYCGTHDPHVPRVPHARFQGTSPLGLRGDAIQQLDATVGTILAALDRHGLTENTLVLFTSDNGPVLFDGYFDQAAEKNGDHRPAGGLRGWKYLVYEGGTRVPFIVRWPARIKPGVDDRMICLSDLMATCAALTDQAVPAATAPDSVNQLRVLLGESGPAARTELVEHGISGSLSLRQGDWKYIPASKEKAASGMGSGANPNDQRWAEAIVREESLFNLADDPAETTNVAAKFPEKTAALRARLEEVKSAR